MGLRATMTSRTGDALGLTLIELLVSVAILAMGSVLTMQALARVAHAQMVAESMMAAHLFAASKMAALELASREGELEPSASGSVGTGDQALRWRATTEAVPEDPAVRAVSLAVAWRHGAQIYERRLDTWLRTGRAAD